jgi:hypothetical protein
MRKTMLLALLLRRTSGPALSNERRMRERLDQTGKYRPARRGRLARTSPVSVVRPKQAD